jgi:hypothetical protein
MQRVFLLNNNQRRHVFHSENALQQVQLVSFEYNVKDADDLSSFMFQWHLPGSQHTACQHYNMAYKKLPPLISGLPKHDLLKRLQKFYGEDDQFYSFTIELGKSFRSNESSLVIIMDTCDLSTAL